MCGRLQIEWLDLGFLQLFSVCVQVGKRTWELELRAGVLSGIGVKRIS